MNEKIEYVSDNARNGLVTAVGIILGFTLAFIVQFCLSPGEWEGRDIPALIFLIIGTIILMACFYRALYPYKQKIHYYELTVKIFTLGAVPCSAIGVAFGIIL